MRWWWRLVGVLLGCPHADWRRERNAAGALEFVCNVCEYRIPVRWNGDGPIDPPRRVRCGRPGAIRWGER